MQSIPCAMSVGETEEIQGCDLDKSRVVQFNLHIVKLRNLVTSAPQQDFILLPAIIALQL